MMARLFSNARSALALVLLLAWCGGAAARPAVVAHRGGTALGPENRLETFERAARLGVEAIELDIHQSRDGHLMVIHDATLQRTYKHTGRVEEMTLEQLRSLGVPTLEEAIIRVAGRCRLFVEIKTPGGGRRYLGLEERLLELLRRHHLVKNTLVLSFDREAVRRVHQLEPTLATGLLFWKPVNLAQSKAELGITVLGPHFLLVTPELLRQARQLGLKVNVWTVDDPALMKQLSDAGCDAITTDEPELLRRLLTPK